MEQVDAFIERLSNAHFTRDEDDEAERGGELIDASTLPRDDELFDTARGRKAARHIHDLDEVSVLGRSEATGRLETWFAEICDSKLTRSGCVRARFLVETSPNSNVYTYEHSSGGSQSIHFETILDVFGRGHLRRITEAQSDSRDELVSRKGRHVEHLKSDLIKRRRLN